MQTYISMLRGINVSGKNKIKMADLRALYGGMGFTNVKSYVQSGNVVFDSAETPLATLEQQIKNAIHQQYGYDVAVMVRTPANFADIIANKPHFADEEDPTQLLVTFLSAAPTPEAVAAAAEIDSKSDTFVVQNDVIYVFTPGGYGKTKLSNNFFERKLKVSATTRNWRSLNKIFDLTNKQ